MTIQSIEEKDLCMQCGLCVSVCPYQAIEIRYKGQDGFYHPAVRDDLCKQCGRCLRCCPAENNNINQCVLGPYTNLMLAHSTNATVRRMSTSGGVINSLVRFVIASGMVDCVLMVARNNQTQTETSYVVITSDNVSLLEETPRDFASRYVAYPILSALRDVQHQYKRIAVVATPCQIRALSLLQDQRIVLKIGLACSGAMSFLATKHYKDKMGMPQGEFYYRGKGWPGYNTLTFSENIEEHAHQGSLFERMFSSQIFKKNGCRYCGDQFAECADISFCDFWDKDEMKQEHEGNSCVIVRSHYAQAIINSMIDKDWIHVVKYPTQAQVANTQMHVIRAKKGNLHHFSNYRRFVKLCNIIMKTNAYKLFSRKTYHRFCIKYGKIINQTQDTFFG